MCFCPTDPAGGRSQEPDDSNTSCLFRSDWIFGLKFDFLFIAPQQFYNLRLIRKKKKKDVNLKMLAVVDVVGVQMLFKRHELKLFLFFC